MHAFDKFLKCDHTINNMIESWNAWLGEMRKAPFIALVEHIRKRMIKAITERRETCLNCLSDVPAFINKKMNSIITRKALIYDRLFMIDHECIMKLQHFCDT